MGVHRRLKTRLENYQFQKIVWSCPPQIPYTPVCKIGVGRLTTVLSRAPTPLALALLQFLHMKPKYIVPYLR